MFFCLLMYAHRLVVVVHLSNTEVKQTYWKQWNLSWHEMAVKYSYSVVLPLSVSANLLVGFHKSVLNCFIKKKKTKPQIAIHFLLK